MRHSFFSLGVFAIALVYSLSGGTALGNQIPVLTLDEIVAASKIVIIGQADNAQEKVDADGIRFSHIHVMQTLKGNSPKFVYVLTFSGISEQDRRIDESSLTAWSTSTWSA